MLNRNHVQLGGWTEVEVQNWQADPKPEKHLRLYDILCLHRSRQDLALLKFCGCDRCLVYCGLIVCSFRLVYGQAFGD